MADGSAMRVHPAPDTKPLGLDEAIRLLEAGQGQDICVDLGDGRLARADGPRGSEGLLQRLRGHKMMLALASGAADLSHFTASPHALTIAPGVQEILDATTQRD
ncbi:MULTISPECIES: hypothetical protein [unclassified Hyphomonas]|jgi:hypothetical protein|uniref:hypothetical protein n=1 Tax=unclassified Hyphomonas TaxID=2630699 RepID=UPI000458C95F|nr:MULTISPECIES: hypothetical protein [unclassified Hyphomonas]KCZ50090.1 hypothetical protein HY17_02975 [Hyphomonas sp. CY54-11-8]RAN39249.1 hypothetical protein HY26_16565 [Hyphomonas sp. GM-8P]